MLGRECLSEFEYWNGMLKLHRYIYTQKIVYALAFEKGIPETT